MYHMHPYTVILFTDPTKQANTRDTRTRLSYTVIPFFKNMVVAVACYSTQNVYIAFALLKTPARTKHPNKMMVLEIV